MVTIGEATLSTRKPQDLDAALLASTGCSASEVATIIAGTPNAGQIAAALRPFLPQNAAHTNELAQNIADSGLDAVADQVRKLYASDTPAPVAEEQTEGE